MARRIFPDAGTQLVYTTGTVRQGSPLQSMTGVLIKIFLDQACTVIADLQSYPGGSAITDSVLTAGTDSQIPLFYGPPDGTDTLWALPAGATTPYAIRARTDDRLDALETSTTSLNTAIATETTNRQNAISGEAATRAAQDALLIPLSQKAAANGVATLDSGGLLPAAQLPSLALTDVFTVASQAAMLTLTAHLGDVAVRTDLVPAETFILAASPASTLSNWVQITTPGAVTSVAGKTGAVSITAADSAFTPSGTATATNVQTAVTALAGVTNALNPLTGYAHAAQYGADRSGVTECSTALNAAITAAGGGTVLIEPGTYTTTSPLIVAHDQLTILASGVTLNYTGAGVAIQSDNTAIRRSCKINGLTLNALTAGARALKLDNAYRWVMKDCTFQSQNGTTGYAVDIVGSLTKSTYFNTFINCDAWGSYASVSLGDNVNGTRWIGGVLEGPGFSILSPATTVTNGTNTFSGVGIQSSGANTAGVIVQLGTLGVSSGTAQSSYSTLVNCRVETSTATTIRCEANALYNSIIGGSIAVNTTIVDASGTTTVLVNSPSTLPYSFGSPVNATSFKASAGTVNEITLTNSGVQATGTGANQNAHVRSKGTGVVNVNDFASDGTGGFAVYSGGATPAIRAALGPNRGADLTPAAGNDALRVIKAGDAFRRFAVDENGRISIGDGTAAPDTGIIRLSAKVSGTDADNCFTTGKNVTGSRPSAATVGAGAQFYDVTLKQPIWSDGANWQPAVPTSGTSTLPPYTINPGSLSSSSTTNANQAQYQRVTSGSDTVTKITLHVNVSSGNIDVGAFANSGNGSLAVPAAKLASSGSIPCPASGSATVTLGASVVATAPDVWFAFVADNATASFYRAGTGGFTTNLAKGVAAFQSTAFPLPTTAAPSGTGNDTGWIMAGVA